MNPKELAKIKIEWFRKGLKACLKFPELSEEEQDSIVEEVKRKAYKK